MAYRSVPRPSSPPGAKASTECPSLAREHGASKCAFHHAQKPSSVGMLPFIAESCSLSTQQSPLNTRPIAEHPKTFGQTVRWERPETHQNLIHPDKDLPSNLVQGTAPPFGDTYGVTVPKRNQQRRKHSLLRDTRPVNSITRGGGGDRTRTDDPLLAKQVLSQLSYTPK